jgi:hypothetical protein
VALTLILSIGAGLFVESLRHAQMFDQGFDPRQVLVASMNLEGEKPAEINATYQRLIQRAKSLPEVYEAALASSIPLLGGSYSYVDDPSSKRSAFTSIDQVSPGYFTTLEIKILQGRQFTPADRLGAPAVVIVNETLAQDLWHGENPLGKCLTASSNPKVCHTVVGVVPDQIRALAAGRTMSRTMGGPAFNTADAFFPLDQSAALDDSTIATPDGLLIRTVGKPSSAEHDFSSAFAELAPNGRLVSVHPLSESMEWQMRPFRLGRKHVHIVWRVGSSTVLRRNLWRAGIPRSSTNIRNRHPHGARRSSSGRLETCHVARNEIHRAWPDHWHRRSVKSYPLGQQPAFRGQANRPNQLPQRMRSADGRRSARVSSSRVARRPRGSGNVAASRIEFAGCNLRVSASHITFPNRSASVPGSVA